MFGLAYIYCPGSYTSQGSARLSYHFVPSSSFHSSSSLFTFFFYFWQYLSPGPPGTWLTALDVGSKLNPNTNCILPLLSNTEGTRKVLPTITVCVTFCEVLLLVGYVQYCESTKSLVLPQPKYQMLTLTLFLVPWCVLHNFLLLLVLCSILNVTSSTSLTASGHTCVDIHTHTLSYLLPTVLTTPLQL